MSFDRDDFVHQLSTLTVGELVQLKSALERAWGVTAAPVAVDETVVPPPPPPPVVPTEFRVVLKNPGANRIAVVRVVRELTGLGLVDARDLVDAAPKEIRAGVSQAEAQQIAARLQEVGAEAEVTA
jgi:large subunit ribosomal protein L7/L12